MKLIIYILAIFTLFGCTAKRSITTTNQSQSSVADTTHIITRETVQDTVIHTLADSSMWEAIIECNDQNQAYIRQISEINGKKVQTRVVFKDKILRFESRINADSIKVYWKNYYEAQYVGNSTQDTQSTVKEDIKRSSPLSWIKWLLIGLVSGVVIMWTKKYWIKLIKLI